MKGLLFTPEMFTAVVSGYKTQTRRIVPGKLKQFEEGWSLNGNDPRLLASDWCQYQPGEVVCALTTWAVVKEYDGLTPLAIGQRGIARLWLAGQSPKPEWAGKSRPGRFMPNALRGFMPQLKIGDVDVQRIQQITEADAAAEGVAPQYYVESALGSAIIESHAVQPVPGVIVPGLGELTKVIPRGRKPFRALWNSINAQRGFAWSRNPWVFAIKFARHFEVAPTAARQSWSPEVPPQA